MLRGSVWYLEQWDRIHSPMYKPFADAVFHSDISDERKAVGWSAGVLYTVMTALSPAIIIGVSPYQGMYRVSSELSLGWRTAMRAEGGMLAHSTGVSRWILAGTDDVFNVVRSRLFLAKAGSRLIPGVGWALFAYDLYKVGQWYMETDF